MKYHFFGLLVIMFLSACGGVPAVAVELEKDVAVVNIQQIMREARAAKSAREQLKAKQKQFQDEIGKKETALQKEDQDLAKQRSILTQEAFDGRVKEFRKKAIETQKDVRAKRQSLSNAYDKALADIQKQVMDIIKELANERGFKLAVPTSQALYFDGGLDITAEVLSRLDKKIPSLTVQF